MVRWVVAGEVFTETFASFALADGFRSELIQAINKGEEFDVATGLPGSQLPAPEPEPAEPQLSWLQFCADYVKARWGEVAAKTRASIADSLATVTPVMVDDGPDRPEPRELRRAFLWAILPANVGTEPRKR
jgi:hypothetical protein